VNHLVPVALALPLAPAHLDLASHMNQRSISITD
jgi:hypothetical protein